jgi:glyoxylase-like metal-dependent hydrolase (beta-lactamase superfamily II)
MPAYWDRRSFLGILAAAAATFSVSRTGFGEQALQPITATRLSAKISLVSGAGGSILVLTGPDGLLLVNGSLPERTADLMKFLADEFKGQPARVLFNTDWHFEHTGSNEAFRKAGAKIISHENTKLWIGADFYSDWEKRTYKPRPADALPTETFYTNGKMTFGGERIEYGYMPQAHTDGDIYVFFPDQNVLVAGDILSVGQYPVLDYVTGGWIGGLQNANQTLLKIANAETRVIPGTGPVQTRADLQAQADMCNAMRDRLVKLMRQGMGPQDMIGAAPSKEFDAKWGNPELFIKNAYRGMWGHVRELGNIV